LGGRRHGSGARQVVAIKGASVSAGAGPCGLSDTQALGSTGRVQHAPCVALFLCCFAAALAASALGSRWRPSEHRRRGGGRGTIAKVVLEDKLEAAVPVINLDAARQQATRARGTIRLSKNGCSGASSSEERRKSSEFSQVERRLDNRAVGPWGRIRSMMDNPRIAKPAGYVCGILVSNVWKRGWDCGRTRQ
jgi:hypothetical protein